MMKNKIKVLVVEVGRDPYVKEIGTGLEDLRAEVGGHIEAVGLDGDYIILDEEGKRTTKEAFRPGQMLILEVDVPIQYTYPANYPETVRITLTGKTDEALLRKGEEKVLLLGGSE